MSNAIVEIDKAGRIVVPKMMRDALHLTPGTRIKMHRSGHTLVLDAEFPEAKLAIVNGFPIIVPGEGKTIQVRELDFFDNLKEQILVERDRRNLGLNDDEIES